MSLERCVLGTASLGGVWAPVKKDESVATILMALQAGITAIDTAPAYGDAEQFVGEALRAWQGSVPAISTKVGRMKSYDATKGSYDYTDEAIMRSVENSLSVLGISQLDILFLHEPDQVPRYEMDRIVETLLALKNSGCTKKIGVGGNAPRWFWPYLQYGIFDVLMEYNRLNACNTSALTDTLPLCQQGNTWYYAASPLHMGLLGDRFLELASDAPAWLNRESIEAAAHVQEVASLHNLALQELAHRFLLSLPYDFRIVIGAADRHQLQTTLDAFARGPLPETLQQELSDHSTPKTA